MRLLFITRRVDKNDGVTGFSYHWVTAFARNVEHLDVICLEKGTIDGLPDNCTVYSMGKEQGKNRFREFITYMKLGFRLVRKSDGVFAHQNPEYGILIAPWTKLYRKRLVAWYTHKSVTWKLRLLTVLADTMVTASKESFRLQSPKVRVLHHGIDTKLFSPGSHRAYDRNSPVILTIGRLSKSKQVEKMIAVCKPLLEEKPGARFIIAGDAVKEDEKAYADGLRKRVAELGLTTQIEFLGSVPYGDTPNLYRKAHLFLNFSRTGSLDKAVLEAMSCGTPVLVTNEAFHDILRSIDEHCYSSEDEAELLEKARYILDQEPDFLSEKLRTIVISKHSLTTLVPEIVRLVRN